MFPHTPPCRLWGWSVFPAAPAVVRATTPEPEVGPTELFEYWPVVVRLGWFLAVSSLSSYSPDLHPARSRTGTPSAEPQQPTLRNALLRYFQIVAIVIAILVGASVAGYGPVLGNSALLISAIALAIGVAAQEVIGSLLAVSP